MNIQPPTIWLSPAQALGILLLQASAIGVWWRQNNVPTASGGGIAFTKALWLVYAITLWLVVPLCLAFNAARHHQPLFAVAMGLLAASMAARGVVEGEMLKRRTWRVRHGMRHDWLHLALCAAVLPLAVVGDVQVFGILYLALNGVALASELVFVRWFSVATAGPQAGIYFVPGGPQHAAVLRRSALITAPQYLVFLTLVTTALI